MRKIICLVAATLLVSTLALPGQANAQPWVGDGPPPHFHHHPHFWHHRPHFWRHHGYAVVEPRAEPEFYGPHPY